ncbi:MAG: hypothetical protein Q7U09_10460 [Hydrogenophaga sp.]|nr:hypothetical protein [Hydrogenophaga sp.]
MSSEFLWIAAVLASAMAWWLFRRPVGRAPASAPRELATVRSALGPVPASSPRPAPAFVATVQPLPDALAGFHWRTESDLGSERHATLIAAVKVFGVLSTSLALKVPLVVTAALLSDSAT